MFLGVRAFSYLMVPCFLVISHEYSVISCYIKFYFLPISFFFLSFEKERKALKFIHAALACGGGVSNKTKLKRQKTPKAHIA